MGENPDPTIVIIILVFGAEDPVSFCQESGSHAVPIKLSNVEDDETFINVVESELICVFVIHLHVFFKTEELHFYL